MKYIELTVTTTSEAEELIADVFFDHTDFGVAVSSLKDVIELTEKRKSTFDYIDENVFSGNENVSLVKGYFAVEEAESLIACVMRDIDALKLRASGNVDLGSLETVTRVVDGDDWIEIWRKHFKPIEFNRIVVCPEWIEYKGDKPVVTIGSNTAFGTGEHETTSMCVGYLEEYVRPGDVVADVGTGSGILGIAAVKLGAKRAYMTDNDDKAIEAALYNAAKNGVSDKCLVSKADLLDGVDISADIVVANITADILCLLAKDILGYIAPGGTLIMSGILNDRATKVFDKYLPLGFKLLSSRSVGEWTAVVLRRA